MPPAPNIGTRATARHTPPTAIPLFPDNDNRIAHHSTADPPRPQKRTVATIDSRPPIAPTSAALVADPSEAHRLNNAPPHPTILVVMGVSGVGKTTIAKELAARLRWPSKEGDSLHPPQNIAKMHAGIPLNDADRRPWLQAVAAWIDRQRAAAESAIITCSALKRAYRRVVIADRPEVALVYLTASPDLVAQRLADRRGHFMPANLMHSQFDALEPPTPEENPITVDASASSASIADQIIRELASRDQLQHPTRNSTKAQGP